MCKVCDVLEGQTSKNIQDVWKFFLKAWLYVLMYLFMFYVFVFVKIEIGGSLHLYECIWDENILHDYPWTNLTVLEKDLTCGSWLPKQSPTNEEIDKTRSRWYPIDWWSRPIHSVWDYPHCGRVTDLNHRPARWSVGGLMICCSFCRLRHTYFLRGSRPSQIYFGKFT